MHTFYNDYKTVTDNLSDGGHRRVWPNPGLRTVYRSSVRQRGSPQTWTAPQLETANIGTLAPGGRQGAKKRVGKFFKAVRQYPVAQNMTLG